MAGYKEIKKSNEYLEIVYDEFVVLLKNGRYVSSKRIKNNEFHRLTKQEIKKIENNFRLKLLFGSIKESRKWLYFSTEIMIWHWIENKTELKAYQEKLDGMWQYYIFRQMREDEAFIYNMVFSQYFKIERLKDDDRKSPLIFESDRLVQHLADIGFNITPISKKPLRIYS